MGSAVTLNELRRWAARAPPGTLIPADSLAAMLADVEAGDDRLGDLTVEQVAAELGRSPSTIRGWCIDGRLHAYKLNHREWRVPRASVRDYLEDQKKNGSRRATKVNGKAADLGEWKQHVK